MQRMNEDDKFRKFKRALARQYGILLVDGVETKAELLDVKKANEVFTNIVKNDGSPALLEFYGKQLIRSTVPRVPANGTVTVKPQYTTVLENQGGLVRLSMLNTNPKALMQPLEEASVKVKITSKTPIVNVYSPTHEMKFTETTDADILIEWDEHASGFGAHAPADRGRLAEEAKDLAENREADDGYTFDKAAEKLYRKQGGKGSVYGVVRYIENRAFYNVDGVWTDSLVDPEKDKEGEAIKVGSERYFALLSEDPAVAPYLAQITVTFKHGGKLYRVAP